MKEKIGIVKILSPVLISLLVKKSSHSALIDDISTELWKTSNMNYVNELMLDYRTQTTNCKNYFQKICVKSKTGRKNLPNGMMFYFFWGIRVSKYSE